MRPLKEFSEEARRQIRGVFCDIDDTLTTAGRLTAAAYSAMDALQKAGLMVVPVTGRPAGWCDHIARMWPVSAVVGENGAFYFRYDAAKRAMQRRYADDDAARKANCARLAAIGEEIVKAIPGAAVAADQLYRETDLAIDYCEDVPRLPVEAVNRIVGIMESRGLTAKVSSIHVNGWFGGYDKLSTARLMLREDFGIDAGAAREAIVFAGDSPNDQPMFGFFPNAVGVANVRDMADLMTVLPAWVTPSRGSAGFAELADALLSAR